MSAPRAAAGDAHPLDNPVRAALTGPHAHFAEHRGRVLRYPADVAPWVAVPDPTEAADRAGAAALAGPGGAITLGVLFAMLRDGTFYAPRTPRLA